MPAKRLTRADYAALYDQAHRQVRNVLGNFKKPHLIITPRTFNKTGEVAWYNHDDYTITVYNGIQSRIVLLPVFKHELVHAYMHADNTNHAHIFEMLCKKVNGAIIGNETHCHTYDGKIVGACDCHA